MSATAVAERAARRAPGEPELWLFILGDLTVFGIFFGVWGWNHRQRPELFELGRAHLDQTIGLTNTTVLITSSAAVALALAAARDGRFTAARRGYLAAIALGTVFAALKVVEYREHLDAGIDPALREFFMYYFVFTGIHLVHVLVGLLGLTIAAFRCRRPGTGPNDLALLEGIGVYWHMVDVLWIVLFALIYLL
ncbi:cytochrome c oxidase subunit 3 [Nocardia neocaledoniensis]|uniref:cytochrome c oxidase subunit 3 n=1 Tax=Nocardia neocaledoniensis TaxID=236511 RepID=UPI00245471F8|nr:cytochrome c oxidase subunit 3 [Nocardia neocaledoniensis]